MLARAPLARFVLCLALATPGAARAATPLAFSPDLAAPLPDLPRREPLARHRLRAALELGGLVGGSLLLYTRAPPPSATPPAQYGVWDKLGRGAIALDASDFQTNFTSHPLAGTAYFLVARANRLGPLESSAWAFAASAAWELGEYREKISLNDLVVTPGGGVAIGEPLTQLASWLGRDHGRRRSGPAAWLLAPFRRLHGAVEGGAPGRRSGGSANLALRLAAGVSSSGTGARDVPELRLGLDWRLFRSLDRDAPGVGTTAIRFGELTAFQLDWAGAERGMAGFRFSSETSLAGVHRRAFDAAGDGQDLLAAAVLAFDQENRHPDRPGLANRDAFSLLHLPGVRVEHRLVRGALRIESALRASFTLGGASSLALALAGKPDGVDLPAAADGFGYFLGWGGSASPSLTVRWRSLAAGASARLDTLEAFRGANAVEHAAPLATLSERRAEGTLHASAAVPGLRGVAAGVALERTLRWSRLEARRAFAGDRAALVTLTFSP